MEEKIKIIYPENCSEGLFADFENKGYFSGATAETIDGKKYKLYFANVGSLKDSIELGAVNDFGGGDYFAYPGLIVIPEVTREYMQAAVEKLFENGYFEHLKPIN